MVYRVKNITDRLFNFEGTVIEPGKVSSELNLDTFQRLMALNYGTALMPVEDGEVAPEVAPEVVEVPVEPVVEPVAEPAPVVEVQAEPMITTDSLNPDTFSDTETVEVNVPVEAPVEAPVDVPVEAPEPAVAEEPVEVPNKKRGRPRKHL